MGKATDKQRAQMRAWYADKYHNDPDFKKKAQAYQRAKRKAEREELAMLRALFNNIDPEEHY